jgi:DNA-binding LytR/AlgR family response regulator
MSEQSRAIDTMQPAVRAGYGRPMRIIGDDVDDLDEAEAVALEGATAVDREADDESDVPSVGLFAGRLFVRDVRGAIVPVPLAQIERLAAQDDYVAVITRERRYLIAARLGELADRLPGNSFLRVHRSHVVNLDYVDRLVPYDAKRLEVRLRDGTRILASRAASERIRRCAR